ncbi:hypothetical protein Ancab_037266 [Ancistrocladus abbreviatus]
MAEFEVPILAEPESTRTAVESPFSRLKRWQWWLLIGLNTISVLVGQTTGVILSRFYFQKGGNCKWLNTFVASVGFPISLIPLLLLPKHSQQSSLPVNNRKDKAASLFYILTGALIAFDNYMFSIGLFYLPASTYTLICATQIAFNVLFSFFINNQKLTPFILNSVVALTLSTSLLATSPETNGPSGLTKWKYLLGLLCTLGASALYSLLLSLLQLLLRRVLKQHNYRTVLKVQFYTSTMATCMAAVGAFASGEWGIVRGELEVFGKGKIVCVAVVCLVLAWQVCSVGVVGLIFMVSSLFSNVVNTVGSSIIPIVAVIVFHDEVNGVKVIANAYGNLGLYFLYISKLY